MKFLPRLFCISFHIYKLKPEHYFSPIFIFSPKSRLDETLAFIPLFSILIATINVHILTWHMNRCNNLSVRFCLHIIFSVIHFFLRTYSIFIVLTALNLIFLVFLRPLFIWPYALLHCCMSLTLQNQRARREGVCNKRAQVHLHYKYLRTQGIKEVVWRQSKNPEDRKM